MFEDFDLIHSYCRRQAINDGVLVDVTDAAREAGFRHPVAVTAAVWGRYVVVPDEMDWQDEAGRLWDILWMLRYAIRQSNNRGDTLLFAVLIQNDDKGPQPMTLKSVCGPDDDGSPCITILMPRED